MKEKIKEVKAFEVNNKLFPTKELAEKYVIEELEDVQLGDHVYLKGTYDTIFADVQSISGVVCKIESQDKIWFYSGDMPIEFYDTYIATRETNPTRPILHNDKTYTWKINCHPRKRLIKSYNVPYLHLNLFEK